MRVAYGVRKTGRAMPALSYQHCAYANVLLVAIGSALSDQKCRWKLEQSLRLQRNFHGHARRIRNMCRAHTKVNSRLAVKLSRERYASKSSSHHIIVALERIVFGHNIYLSPLTWFDRYHYPWVKFVLSFERFVHATVSGSWRHRDPRGRHPSI